MNNFEFSFGKHEGERIENVPSGYLRWALAELDLDEVDAEEIRSELRGRRRQAWPRPDYLAEVAR